MKPFDVNNIKLEGNNLIEASAGTGKTYSIGILVLRLLLEKGIRIEQILMVTFTNAAVAELEIRIRRFLRDALKIASKNSESSDIDPNILVLINKSIEEKGKEEVIKILSDAILFLDETAIFTIHSFCQITLGEFAFETSQLFNTDIIEDQSFIIEDAVNEFWRKEITVLDIEIIRVLTEKKYTRDLLKDFAQHIFNGKRLKVETSIDSNEIIPKIAEYEKIIEQFELDFENTIKDNWSDILSVKISKTSVIQKGIDRDGVKGFITEFKKSYYSKNPPGYLKKFEQVYELTQELEQLENDFDTYKKALLTHFLELAGKFILNEVERKKNRNQVLSFHDLIAKLHSVLVTQNSFDLQQKLCRKYQAVFIDEFQDTDHLQYEIFRKAFIDNCDSTVFFIGDPKQSIYAWRGADLKTYLKAQDDIGDNKFTMKNNFRSTSPLIDAMNEFFPAGTSCDSENLKVSDPFCSDEIQYEKVEPGNENLLEVLYHENTASAFDIVNHEKGDNNNSDLFEAAGREVMDLLNNHYLIDDNIKRKVLPQDIGILMRQNKEAILMKDVLSKYNIPAIVIDGTKVIDTDEARDLYYVIYAIEKLDLQSISRALLSIFTKYEIGDIIKQDFDIHKSNFLKLNDKWKNSGIYSAIINFTIIYKVRDFLLDINNSRGNRIFSNLMQLAEILNEKELNNNYSAEQLLDWFQKTREGLESVNKYEQRIESDENALQISTAHKSKGLSFNFVILPNFNLKPHSSSRKEYITYLEDDGFYISYNKTEEELKRNEFQNAQEDRRLLYVAITRAVYKCIIHYNNQKGVLNNFLEHSFSEKIKFREPLSEIDYKYSQIEKIKENIIPIPFNKRMDDSWALTSYSALDTHQNKFVLKKDNYIDDKNEYEKFIIDELPKGAQTGNLLHDILEKINFTDDSFWENTITRNIQKSGKKYSEFEYKFFYDLLNNTLEAKLYPNTFNLKQIEYDKRFNELEFFFSFENKKKKKIKELLKNINISSKNINGVMHGFIDLLFEFEGKFYILDWKSNHLGNSIDDYSIDKLDEAMTINNYHLQYIVYTIAVKRFLKNHNPEFDYDKHFGGVYYLFLRGLRSGENTGVFYNKPNKDLIEELDRLIG